MLGAWEGQFGPWKTVPGERLHVQRLVERDGHAADYLGPVDGDGRDLTFVGIEPDEAAGPYLEPRLFEHFALRRRLRPLPALYKPAWKCPLPVSWLDVPLHEQHAPV